MRLAGPAIEPYPFESGVVDVHAAYAAIASRISSDRDLCSRAARASRAASSPAVNRSVDTHPGWSPNRAVHAGGA
ncbi:hypothetical protein GCM10025738_14830 [Microbacterium fluvii]